VSSVLRLPAGAVLLRADQDPNFLEVNCRSTSRARPIWRSSPSRTAMPSWNGRAFWQSLS
jgi:hypothetical protein